MAYWHTVLISVLVATAVIRNGESANTKRAHMHCYKKSQTQELIVRATLFKNSDNIDEYYPVNIATKSKITTCTSIVDSNGELSVTKTIMTSTVQSLPDSCGFEYDVGQKSVRAVFRSHENLGKNDVDDRYFLFTCKYNDAIDTYLTTTISTTNSNLDRVIDSSSQKLTMEAVLESTDVSVTNVEVNQEVYLRVDMALNIPYTEPVDFWGCRMFNCKVSKSVNFPNTNTATRTITGPTGCTMPNEEFAPSASFTSRTINDDQFVAVSESLTIKQFQAPMNGNLYFTCDVDFCDGPQGQDQKCLNSCNTSGRRRRRRRDTSSSNYNMTTQITLHLTVSDNVNDVGKLSESTADDVMIGISVGVGVLILVVMSLILCSVFILWKKRSEKEKPVQEAYVYPNPTAK